MIGGVLKAMSPHWYAVCLATVPRRGGRAWPIGGWVSGSPWRCPSPDCAILVALDWRADAVAAVIRDLSEI